MNKSVTECLAEHREVLDEYASKFGEIEKMISGLQSNTKTKKYIHVYRAKTAGDKTAEKKGLLIKLWTIKSKSND